MTKKEEDNVRRRSTIQVLEYARSLGAYNRYGKEDIGKNITWLKKQGEQKKQVHFSKFTFNDVIALQCCMETVKKVQEDKELYEQLNLIHSKIYNDYWLGKQGELSPILSNFSNTEENEQKSNENKDKMIKTDSSNTEMINKKLADKIEPKFKVGDWIVFVKHGSTYQIEKIENYEYTLRHISGGLLDLPFSDENLIKEWTIQDAEDGDVLTCNEDIFIFKSYSELQSSISLYCWYNGKTNNFFDGKVTYVSLNKRNKICPATKEQRDILYQKIKEEKNNNASINKNIDLTKILKDCPEGTKFYSSLWGEVSFEGILEGELFTIEINAENGYHHLTKEGYYVTSDDAECIIFPSKEQRDWSKFTAPWYKKNKFDPKTLNAFDRVLVRDEKYVAWRCGFFSHKSCDNTSFPYLTVGQSYRYCIPYNDDTKHLVGTTEEAPKYYKYWED